MRFEIIAGRHYVGPIQSSDNGGMDYRTPQSIDDGHSHIVESDTDLVEEFGRNKFVRLPDESLPIDDGLEKMTIVELKEWAASEEIDLGGLTKKSAILAVIRDAAVPA